LAITITNTDVTVDNQVASFEDIYQAAVTANKTQYVSKLDTSYLIKLNLRLRNNAIVADTNKSITITGQYIQIPTGCTLKLGDRRSDESTLNGCALNAPNIYNNYGFGSTVVTDSGNLYLYNSNINVFGFWSFFKGDNKVEIIDCFVDGFGRVSGPNSILKNIIFKRSHGRYGSLGTKGTIAKVENLKSFDVYTYLDATLNNTTLQCSLYHNPDFVTNLDIYYGEYSGYGTLLFVESTVGHFITTLYGTKVNGSYSFYRRANNNSFYHKYRFKPKIQLNDGSEVVGAMVTIKDKLGNTEFTGVTDQDGYIDTWLTYLRNIKDVQTNQIMTPHTITIVKNAITLTGYLYVDKNMDDFPLYLDSTSTSSESAPVDYDRIQTMISAGVTSVCSCTGIKTDLLENKISQIMLALGEEIQESQTLIQSENNITVVL
jgi:hypothetical protein